MTKENKGTGRGRRDTRSELKREGTRKVGKLAEKAGEKVEKKLRARKNR